MSNYYKKIIGLFLNLTDNLFIYITINIDNIACNKECHYPEVLTPFLLFQSHTVAFEIWLKSNLVFQVYNNTYVASEGICNYYYTIIQLLMKNKYILQIKGIIAIAYAYGDYICIVINLKC